MHAYMCVPLYLCVPLSFSLCMYACVTRTYACVHVYACMLCAYAVWGGASPGGGWGLNFRSFLMSALLLNSVLPVVIFFFFSSKVPEPKQMTRICPVLGFRAVSLKGVGEMAQWLRTLVALA